MKVKPGKKKERKSQSLGMQPRNEMTITLRNGEITGITTRAITVECFMEEGCNVPITLQDCNVICSKEERKVRERRAHRLLFQEVIL